MNRSRLYRYYRSMHSLLIFCLVLFLFINCSRPGVYPVTPNLLSFDDSSKFPHSYKAGDTLLLIRSDIGNSDTQRFIAGGVQRGLKRRSACLDCNSSDYYEFARQRFSKDKNNWYEIEISSIAPEGSGYYSFNASGPHIEFRIRGKHSIEVYGHLFNVTLDTIDQTLALKKVYNGTVNVIYNIRDGLKSLKDRDVVFTFESR